MQPEWEYVKKSTLWHYEELLKKLQFVQGHPVIWQAYNHSMPQAVDFARGLFPANNTAAGEYPAQILRTIGRLEQAGIPDWAGLLIRVATREDCMAFLAEKRLDFKEFIDLLQYLLRWAFPFQTASRELLDSEDPQEAACYGVLKQHRLMHSFDILEQGFARVGRQALAESTRLDQDFVVSLVHRADIARLPFVRRKTLLPVGGAGYDTLARIAAADVGKMQADLDAYFRREKGKPWENYRAVFDLQGMVAAARVLPEIMDG